MSSSESSEMPVPRLKRLRAQEPVTDRLFPDLTGVLYAARLTLKASAVGAPLRRPEPRVGSGPRCVAAASSLS